MLHEYGPPSTVRILEKIRFWKNQERENTSFVKLAVPELKEPYVKLLDEWDTVFAATEHGARSLLEATSSSGASDAPDPAEVNRLAAVAAHQSREFIRHLHAIEEQNAEQIQALRGEPAGNLLSHVIRESEYFLGVLGGAGHFSPPAGFASDALAHDPAGIAAVPASGTAAGGSAGTGGGSSAGITAQVPTGLAQGFSARIGSGLSTGTAVEPSAGSATGSPAGAVPGASTGIISGAVAGASVGSAAGAAGTTFVSPQQEGAPLLTYRNLASVPIGGHRLPPLPYPYNALEPHIDEKTMRIHHDIHHKSYVDGLNKAEKKLAEARKSGDFDLVKHWERELAFNGAGHYLHTIFWDEMSPQGGGRPTGALLAAIERDFGSYDAFKKQFSEAAEKVEGSGWAILVWSPRSRRLEILTAEKHQNLSQWDVIPLLALDVWEHAYYLKHQNKRGDYIQDWWKVVNWPYVSERFAAASKLAWKPY